MDVVVPAKNSYQFIITKVMRGIPLRPRWPRAGFPRGDAQCVSLRLGRWWFRRPSRGRRHSGGESVTAWLSPPGSDCSENSL